MVFDADRIEDRQQDTETAVRHKILVVDDEAANRRVIVGALAPSYDSLSAESAEQALEIIRNNPDISLVISDQRMPGQSGVDLLETCHAELPHVVGIIMTGYVDIDAVISAINHARVFRFLLKPVDRQDLIRTIEMGIREFENQQTTNRRMVELQSEVERRERELDDTRAQAEQESLTDRTTGLFNRRFLDRIIPREQALILRHLAHQETTQHESRGSLHLLLVELTGLGGLRERFGDQGCDVTLNKVARVLESSIEDSDLLARRGEAEFLVVSHATPSHRADDLADRVLKALKLVRLRLYGQEINDLSSAIGFASLPCINGRPEVFQWSEVLHLAERCRDAARRSGTSAWVGVHAAEAPALAIDDDVPADPELLVDRDLVRVSTSLDDSDPIHWR